MSTGTADLPSFTTRLAKVTLHDRIVGTLVASALGDAVGLYTEFLSSERALKEYPHARFSLTPPTPFARDQHRLKHQLGEWTDDTDHALLLLLGYLHSGVSNPSDLAKRLHIWVSQGLRALDSLPLGLGATTGRIVHDPSFLTDPLAIAHAVWKKGGYEIAPNGSLMRTHPLGLTCLLDTEEGTMDTAARISCVTHVDPRCVVACMIGTALVRGLVHCDVRSEEDVDGVIDRAAERYRDVVRPELEKGVFTADEPGLDLDEVSAGWRQTARPEAGILNPALLSVPLTPAPQTHTRRNTDPARPGRPRHRIRVQDAGLGHPAPAARDAARGQVPVPARGESDALRAAHDGPDHDGRGRGHERVLRGRASGRVCWVRGAAGALARRAAAWRLAHGQGRGAVPPPRGCRGGV